MLAKFLSVGIVAVLAATLFLSCGKYNEKGQANDSKEVATAMNVAKVTLDVQGMTCSGCEYSVKSALKEIAGVTKAEASFANKSAEVEFDPEVATVAQLVEAVNKTGFKAQAPKSN